MWLSSKSDDPEGRGKVCVVARCAAIDVSVIASANGRYGDLHSLPAGMFSGLKMV